MKLFKKKKIKIDNVVSNTNQLDRIESLKTEIHRLEKVIDGYVKREREIEEVLNFAKARAEEYEREAKIKFTLERERLASYREKWQKRLDSLGDAERLGEEVIKCNNYFKQLSNELRDIVEGENIAREEPAEAYVRESKRLKELGVSSMPELVLSEDDLNKLLLQFNK